MNAFSLSDTLEDLQAAAERFARTELSPRARAAEGAGRWPAHSDDVARQLGLCELDVPTELGGAGAGALAKVVLLEALAVGDAGGLPALDQPGPVVGALLACPDAARAREIAAAGLSGVAGSVLVVCDPETHERPRLDWAPARPQCRWVWITSGDRLGLFGPPDEFMPAPALAFGASGAVSSNLEGCREVGNWELAPGTGLAVRARARLWAAAIALGVAQSALDATITYATERVVFGKPVAHHQGNAFALAALATAVHGARLAVRDAASDFDAGVPDAPYWATQAAISALDVAVETSDAGIQLLGGHGFLVDHLAEKRFREARMLGLLWGGRDAALSDVASLSLEIGDPLYSFGAGP
jgi:alkylation response protein AidB-like acyl-CoA dehydrogenase